MQTPIPSVDTPVVGHTDITEAVEVSYLRQTDLFDPSTHGNVHVAIIGCGNIGSNAALALARLGIKHLTLVDHDTVEPHNLPSQQYRVADVGRLKVDALKEQIEAVAPECRVDTIAEAYHGANLDAPVLVSAVDSIPARRAIADGMRRSGYTPFVIDGRSGGGQVEVHAQPLSAWTDTMPEEADEDPCGSRFICYASLIVGAFIASTVRRHLTHLPVRPRVIFHVDTYQTLY